MALPASPDAAALPQRRKGPTPHFPVKPSVVEQTLQLWRVALKALLAAGLSENGVPGATVALVQRLHAALVAEEEAAVAVMAAVALLPYEQLQTLQMVLDEARDYALSDFLHVAAFHTSRPFAHVPLGEDPTAWRARTLAAGRADRAARDAAEAAAAAAAAAAKTAQAAAAHIWQADVQRSGPQLGGHADALAGRAWRPPRADEVAAELAARRKGSLLAAAAKPEATATQQHVNAWQRASQAASAFAKAEGAQLRRSMARPRQSMHSAEKSQAQAAAAGHGSADSAGHAKHHGLPSYTGLPYAAWHTAAAPGAVAQGAVPTAPGAAAETHDDEHALLTPALDAIVLTKGPGAYVSAEVQAARRRLAEELDGG